MIRPIFATSQSKYCAASDPSDRMWIDSVAPHLQIDRALRVSCWGSLAYISNLKCQKVLTRQSISSVVAHSTLNTFA